MEFEVTSDQRTGKPIACRVVRLEAGSVSFEVCECVTYAGCSFGIGDWKILQLLHRILRLNFACFLKDLSVTLQYSLATPILNENPDSCPELHIIRCMLSFGKVSLCSTKSEIKTTFNLNMKVSLCFGSFFSWVLGYCFGFFCLLFLNFLPKVMVKLT